MPDISNSEDLLNSEDIIERIAELEEERENLESDLEAAQEALDDYNTDSEDYNAQEADALADAISTARNALEAWDQSEDADELRTLKAFAADLEGYGDWEHGETLIRESYFVEYVQDMLEDCGDIPRDFPSYIRIDWEATANNIRVDYTESDFDGVTYLMRA